MTNGIRPAAFFALFLLLLFGIPLRAQPAGSEISVAAGAAQFDASGTGTGPVAAIRAAAPLMGRWMLGEISLSYASLDEQFSTTDTRIGVAELQLQAQWPAARVRPYLGLGGGMFTYFNNDVGRDSPTLTYSGSAGLRVPFASSLLFRGELRLRGWQSTSSSSGFNSTAEWTAGIGYIF